MMAMLFSSSPTPPPLVTMIKKKKMSPYVKKIQKEAVAKSYMTNVLLIYD
jgi:hypothetical protein